MRPFNRRLTVAGLWSQKTIRSVVCGGRHTCATVAKEWVKDAEAEREAEARIAASLPQGGR